MSYIAQWDPRVKAVVALDNLGGPGPDAAQVPGQKSSLGEAGCPADPAARTTVPITKPGLGISADYGLPPTPNTSLPDPTYKEEESKAYTQAGVDTGEIVIRGGSHLDFSWIPNQAFGASLRGPDITDWYTTAWFDKYLKHDPTADERLLSNRWRTDPVEAGVDPNHDPNAFSFYYYSRLDFRLTGGGTFDCEDLRDGCPGMTSNDGYPGNYSYVSIDTTPDALTGPGASLRASSGFTACKGRIRFRLARALTRVTAFVDGHRVLNRRGHRAGVRGRLISIPALAGRGRHTIRIYEYRHGRLVARITRRVSGCDVRRHHRRHRRHHHRRHDGHRHRR